MTDYKSLLASRTFWGAAVAIVATALQMFGVANMEAADQAALVDAGLNLTTIAGSLLAVYGRVKATKKIG